MNVSDMVISSLKKHPGIVLNIENIGCTDWVTIMWPSFIQLELSIEKGRDLEVVSGLRGSCD